MSQTFRSRDKQVKAFSKAILHEQYAWHTWLNRISSEFSEAEARGAAEERAEERAKASEGQYPSAWLYMDGTGWRVTTNFHEATSNAIGDVNALFDRPANVAALEERVKELEDQERKDAQVIHWLAEKLKDADPDAKTDCELIALAAITREGGV